MATRFAVVLLTLALGTLLGAAAAPPLKSYSYGDGAINFFTGGGALYLDYRQRQMTDCSTESTLCYRAGDFAIAAPRHCADGPWENAPGLSTIVAVIKEPDAAQGVHPWGSGTVYEIGDRAIPYILYEYDPAIGVRMIYFDKEKRRDFVSMAEKGTLAQYSRAGAKRDGVAFVADQTPALLHCSNKPG